MCWTSQNGRPTLVDTCPSVSVLDIFVLLSYLSSVENTASLHRGVVEVDLMTIKPSLIF